MNALPWLAGLLDDRVQGLAERTSPWNKATRTFRVDLARHGRVGVQVGRPEHRERIRRRVTVSRFLAAEAGNFRVPEVISDGSDSEVPFVVTSWAEGRSLSSFLATPSGRAEAAARLHAVLGELSRLSAAPAALSTIWADPDQLQRAAAHWFQSVGPRLDARTAAIVVDCVERMRIAVDFASPGFAHGDVVPVNVLVGEGGAVTVLDFEDARCALGLYDRAMAWTTLALHHPDAASSFESLFAKAEARAAPSVDVTGLAVTGCLQRLERAYDSLHGLGNEGAAIGELARAAQLVASREPASRGNRLDPA